MSCAAGSAGCATFYFEKSGCTGTAFLPLGHALIQSGYVVDGFFRYAAGAVATRNVASYGPGPGNCSNLVGWTFPMDGAEATSIPVSSLGVDGAFHLAR